MLPTRVCQSGFYLDDALRAALDSEVDGMPTLEFTDLIVAQMRRDDSE
jgi:hypothetical protein